MSIESEIRQALKENGRTAQGVYDWVRAHKKSEMYKRLEWDNTVAAEKYRISQVRTLIRLYVVDVATENNSVRAMVSVPTNSSDRRQYHDRRTLMRDELRRLLVVQDAVRRSLGELESLGFRECDPLVITRRGELEKLGTKIAALETPVAA